MNGKFVVLDEQQVLVNEDPRLAEAAAEAWAADAVRNAMKFVEDSSDQVLQATMNDRQLLLASLNASNRSALRVIRQTAELAKEEGRMRVDGFWNKIAFDWLVADFAEEAVIKRMEKATAPALAPSRRAGRL